MRTSERPATATRSRFQMLGRLREDHLLGVHFALNVFISSIIVWITLGFFTNASPIWAMASMIASSEPVVKQGLKMFRSRLINTLVGCAPLVGSPPPAAWCAAHRPPRHSRHMLMPPGRNRSCEAGYAQVDALVLHPRSHVARGAAAFLRLSRRPLLGPRALYRRGMISRNGLCNERR